jgi:endogenous inhibitor of DNA gyrase (YacG/DUF329 family)
MTTHKKPLQVICPTCQKPVNWVPDNTFRPFCSERCKMIDLGVWASEGYSIADDGEDPLSDQVASEPSGLQ